MRPFSFSAQRPVCSRGVCVLLALLLIATSVLAQSSLPQGYRSYPLRHRNAESIAPQLRTMLSGVAGGTRVLVDTDTNRLVVQGPAQAQELAGQFVTALDQPVTAPAVDPKPANTFRAYQTGGADPTAVATKLRAQFRLARIEADPGTGRVLVVAPEGTHRQLAAVFQSDRPQAAPTSSGHILRHVSWRDFEDHLRRLWGSQVSFATARGGELASVTLATANGPQTIMQFDRRSNQVTFNGDLGVARVWRNLTNAIDKPLAANEASYLVSLRNADPAKVQRAVALAQPTSTGDDGQVTAMVPLNRQRFNQDVRTALLQQGAAPAGNQPAPAAPEGQALPAADAGQEAAGMGTGLIGSVQIEFLEGLDAIIIRGRPQDVARVRDSLTTTRSREYSGARRAELGALDRSRRKRAGGYQSAEKARPTDEAVRSVRGLPAEVRCRCRCRDCHSQLLRQSTGNRYRVAARIGNAGSS
jgi:type II secretory pathway component GspD/PulD (secretin)